MNKPITPEQMTEWVEKTWRECQEMQVMKGPMIQGPLFEVTVTEYERGWGQRLCPDETRIFTNRQDAEAYARTRNSGTAEIYWRAEIRQFG